MMQFAESTEARGRAVRSISILTDVVYREYVRLLDGVRQPDFSGVFAVN